MIVALAGGVGAARFLDGLARIVPPRELFIVGNVGDDAEMHGLHIAPDLDTVMYTLAGVANRRQGWGLERETFHCMGALETLGGEAWFRLGDRDLATHLYRTERLRAGASLSAVTSELCAALGVKARIVPATDGRLRTIVRTKRGRLEFQEYFVRRRARDAVLGFDFDGARQARPTPSVLKAISAATAIILCPSNPFISIGPILAVRGIREALRRTRAPVVAISPIVGGRAVKGPAARMMKSMGHDASATAVAAMYRDFVEVFVLDRTDARLAPDVEALGMRAIVTNTIMSGVAQRKALARVVMRACGADPLVRAGSPGPAVAGSVQRSSRPTRGTAAHQGVRPT
jgi:LPPG:FO 2-phospho-L-lactate transferase